MHKLFTDCIEEGCMPLAGRVLIGIIFGRGAVGRFVELEPSGTGTTFSLDHWQAN